MFVQTPIIEQFAMTWDSVAATKLADLIKPTSSGEPVNAHVVESVREPQPDFAAMKRTVEGRDQKVAEKSRGREERDLPKND
jgi:hypothetical protein